MSPIARLFEDERAIEGLPIRLIIAFEVGVATLSVMLNIISGVGSFAVAELDVKPTPDVIRPEETDLELQAVGRYGAPVADATNLVKRGSADLDAVAVTTTGSDGTATVTIGPSLRPNQAQGTLEVDIKPPAVSKYKDRRGNADILVVAGAS